MTRWGGLAGAVVGIFSLASTAYSLGKLVPSSAKISAVPLACGSDSVSIAFANLGDKAGLVEAVELHVRIDGADGQQSLLTPKSNGKAANGDSSIVEPGKTRVIAYYWQTAGVPGVIPRPTEGAHDCTYIISVKTVDFEDATGAKELKCTCPKI